MSKTRDTGFLGNVVKYDANGNVTIVNGATTLLSVSSSGQLTVPGDEVITGSLTVLGGITGAITGSATSASYAANASLLNGSGSGEFVPTGSFNTFSSSILTYTGSVDSRLGSLEITSGSNITRLSSIESTTGSLNTASGSAITRLNALEVTSGSNITRISSLETASGSAITRLNSIESKTGSYATTGSNTFDGGQYLSSSFNPTGFSTTASLYTDGGLRVTKDAYISGTLYLNNVTVYGTQSVCYITSSQLNIASNLISVNTATPSVRFGGLAVYDSGSTGLTGSLLWDSQNNHWVYSNPSGSSYSGGMFISGPRTSTLGSETGTTSCMLLAGQGGDHLTSSMIYHDSTVTCIPTAIVGGSTACFSSTVCAPRVEILRSSANNGLFVYSNSGATAIGCTMVQINGLTNDSTGNILTLASLNDGIRTVFRNDGNVGIGTATPDAKLVIGEDSSSSNVGYIRLKGHDIYEGNIYKTSTYGLYLDTDSNARPVRIDGSCLIAGIYGTVILGDTTPVPSTSYRLDVAGGYINIRPGYGLISRSASTECWGLGDTDFNFIRSGCLGLGTFTAKHMMFGTNNNVRQMIASSGEVCFACQICTPSVISCLSVNTGHTALKICNPNPGSSAFSQISIFNDTTNQAGLFYNSSTRSADGGVCSFSMYNDSATGNIRIRTGNNIVLATGASATDRLTINSSGISIFACQVCAPSTHLNSSNIGTLLLGTTPGSSQIAARITGTCSPSYNATGKIGFSVTTWGANTDYGLTEVMAIDMRNADNKNPVIWMNPFGGKVGIGNTNPNNVVDIYDATYNSNTAGVLAARTRGGGTFITGRVVTAETANQTLTIATFGASGTNERIFAKIQVVNVSAVANTGNVHVGYALWIGSGGSTVTTMTLDSGNSNISNSNVGSLSWSGNNLQYTTNRAGNYELNSITIWGSARDTGVIS